MMKRNLVIALLILTTAVLPAAAGEFRHIGDFILDSRLKITGDQVSPVLIKPILLSVFTDGLSVRVSAEGDPETASEFTIYRSDGIGRQTSHGGALEVVPGVQATSEKAGVFRQLRLTRDTLTITSFPGVSDQTIITRAHLAPPADPPPAS